MKNIIDTYIERTNELISECAPLVKTDTITAKVRALTEDMRSHAEACNDEMLYPILYNAAATIATAPEGCPVRQLTEALGDAKTEMEIMREYI